MRYWSMPRLMMKMSFDSLRPSAMKSPLAVLGSWPAYISKPSPASGRKVISILVYVDIPATGANVMCESPWKRGYRFDVAKQYKHILL